MPEGHYDTHGLAVGGVPHELVCQLSDYKGAIVAPGVGVTPAHHPPSRGRAGLGADISRSRRRLGTRRKTSAPAIELSTARPKEAV